ncbi:MAG: twin-arginine translocase subunit TatC [Terriglobia bacterium]|jgi:sec-independent protein translocase protein TatC
MTDEQEPSETSESKMSFFDHLEELRRRILYSAVGFVVAFFVCWTYWEPIYNYLAKPINDVLGGEKLIYLNPTEPFTLSMKLGFIGGIFLASPWLLWQLWLFISPGLYKNEKRFALPFVLFSSVLFVAGGAFGYYLAFPYTLKFLIGYAPSFKPQVTISEYFDLASMVLIGLGIIFQLPVLIMVLSAFGLITPRFLWKNFQYAVLIIAILAAIITPTTDIPTMMLFMAPMLGLYLIGIPISWIFARKRAKKRS